MKKIFTLIAAAFVAVSVNAQASYDLKGITSDKITVDANGVISTCELDGVTVPSVNYVGEGSAVMEVKISDIPVAFQYKNSKTKDNILKFSADFVQADGKNVIMVIQGLKAGDVISFDAKAKGGTNAAFTANDNCTADSNNPADVDKSEYKTFKFTVAKDGNASIKETGGGYRVATINVTSSGTDGINSVGAEQTNGKMFNLAGQEIKAGAKGIVIQNGKKYIK